MFSSSKPRLARYLAVVGVTGLAVLTVAYWITLEPAPRIRVQWREDLPARQQIALEWKYSLLNARERIPNGSTAYDLLDTSRSNIKALVEDPAIADTNDIDRDAYVVQLETDRGGEWMWIAYRIPGLREAWSRWVVILLLAVSALCGLTNEALAVLRKALRKATATVLHLVKVWNAHRRRPTDSQDLFDTIPSRATAANQANARGSPLTKVVTAALLLLAAGLPVLETWESLALAAAFLALVFGECRRGAWRLLAAVAVVLAVVGLKAALPRADIAEAHNAFLVLGDKEPLEQGLPPQVFNSWRAQFDALYPEGNEPPPAWSWREQKSFPKTLYARSTDAIWRPAKYTRQVDTIGFRSLAEFRGGFTNELSEYNFYAGDMDREEMPFYAMYELTAASVGSRLRWMGQLFWERSDGSFEEIVHEQIAERTIGSDDAGKRVYAAFFPKRPYTFDFQLLPSLKLRIAGWADALLTLLGGLSVLMLVIRPRWPDYLRALSICLIAYYIMIACFVTPSSARLGKEYFPHGGGNDGLLYENHGRVMATLVRHGHFIEALKGIERVYYFTPGTRYVRMVEKLIFGDTNHLFALIISAIPLLVFYLMRRLVGALPAWVLTAIFCIVPAGNPSFLQYVTNARAGYGEGIACALFLLGLNLILYHLPGTLERRLTSIWTGGAMLAASMFIRPNFALAVVWIGCLYVLLSWRRQDLRSAVVIAAGLALALWMPFHNWYYGGQWYLVSSAGATISVPLGPSDYWTAIGDLLQGRSESPVVDVVWVQLKGWLWDPVYSFRPLPMAMDLATRLLRLSTLIAAAYIAVRWLTHRYAIRVELAFLAGAALAAHVPMLFIFSTYHRFAILAWDLSMVVSIAWILGHGSRRLLRVRESAG